MHDFGEADRRDPTRPSAPLRTLRLAHSSLSLPRRDPALESADEAETGRGTTGVAIVCSDHGVIRRMVWDDVGAARWISTGDRLSRLVRPADEARAEALLERVRNGAVVSDYDLYLVLPPRVVPFKLFGCRFGAGSLLLVGSTSRSRVVRLFEQLLRTGSEQAATLRALLQDSHLRLQAAHARNAELFAEVGRLRAEVAALHGGAARAVAPGEGRRGEIARGGPPAALAAPGDGDADVACQPSAAQQRRRRAAGEVRATLRGLVVDRDRLGRELVAAGQADAAGGVSRVADLAASLLQTLEAGRD